jgi:hypothetical protein
MGVESCFLEPGSIRTDFSFAQFQEYVDAEPAVIQLDEMKEIHHMTGNYFHVPVNSTIILLDAPPSTRYNLPADVNGVVTT